MTLVKTRSGVKEWTPTKFTLVAILLSSMLMLMGGAAVAPALPAIKEVFEDQDFLVSLIITLPSLAVAITGFLMGILADKFGKVRTLIISLVIFTVGGVASYFLDNLYIILVMRFIVGIGIAGITTCVTALITEYYTGMTRVKVLSYQSAFMGVGVLVLETVGGTLSNYSWHDPFLVYLIGIPILICVILAMKEPAPVDRSPDPEASAINEDNKPKRKANTRLIVVCYVTIFVVQLLSFLLPTEAPSLLEDDLGVNAGVVGLFLGLNGISNAVLALCYSRIVAHIRPFTIISIGFLLMGAGYVLIMLAPTVATMVVAMILAGAGLGMISPALSNTLAAEATASTSGKIMGGFSTFLNLGQFCISLLSVPLLALVNEYIPDLFGMMGVVGIIVGVIFIVYCAHDHRFKSLPSGQ